MTGLPIRVRLTAVFAIALVAVLAGTAAFVYVQVRADLNESVDETLESRGLGLGEDPDDGFAQIVSDNGTVLETTGGARGLVLTPAELERAATEPFVLERRVPGIDGVTRIRAEPRAADVFVVGQSLEDRDETLGSLLTAFVVGGVAAVLIASLVGYALASAALRPVEAMRRRAAGISLGGAGEQRLPLPAARDEVRRLGETLNDMLDRLRRAFERERQFVADASHELRTPIAVLKTEVEAALRARDLPDEARASLVAAAAECDHLAQLAEDLLVVARAADGRLAIRPEPQDARAALEAARDRFAQRGRTIRVDAPAGMVVVADELRLRQALNNLVDNALRHGAGDVTLAARRNGDGVELSVSDEGEGFPPELAARAFERFTRGDEARTRGGAGLGLAIVRAIAEAHGGTATAEGATVRLWLPSQEDLSRAA